MQKYLAIIKMHIIFAINLLQYETLMLHSSDHCPECLACAKWPDEHLQTYY